MLLVASDLIGFQKGVNGFIENDISTLDGYILSQATYLKCHVLGSSSGLCLLPLNTVCELPKFCSLEWLDQMVI